MPSQLHRQDSSPDVPCQIGGHPVDPVELLFSAHEQEQNGLFPDRECRASLRSSMAKGSEQLCVRERINAEGGLVSLLERDQTHETVKVVELLEIDWATLSDAIGDLKCSWV